MVDMLHMVMIWQIILTGATDDVLVRMPVGVRMCVNLCKTFGQCQTPVYTKKDLCCYMNSSRGISKESGVRLKIVQNKAKQQYYRKIFSKTKETVFIKKKIIRRQQEPNRTKPKGYITLKSGMKTSFIKRYTTEMTWGEAHKFCQSGGADLIKVDSKQKQVAVKRKVQHFMHIDGKNCMWIGLTDPDKNNKYRWTDGTPMVYTNWYSTKLSNFTGSVWDTECVCMNRLFMMGLHWKDMYCDRKHGFFCEIR